MKLSHAATGFILHKAAEGKSQRTLDGYKAHLALLTGYLEDPEMSELDTAALRAFMAYLRTDYVSTRPIAVPKQLAPKTLRNYWITLRSFVTWAMAECGIADILKPLNPPEFEPPEIDPLTEAEVQALLQATSHTRRAKPDGKVAYTMRRPTARRDRALLLSLLDTGLRASELARLHVDDVDLNTGAVLVSPHNSSRKSKPRTVYLGNTARKALWRYITTRGAAGSDPLFAAGDGKPLGRTGIRFICRRLGAKAEVAKPVYPHRFRHTFAITFLRNGGDIYTLQRQLGHTSLEMVRRYLAIVQNDVAEAHRRASPADNWNL